jgi:hypothetical protein
VRSSELRIEPGEAWAPESPALHAKRSQKKVKDQLEKGAGSLGAKDLRVAATWTEPRSGCQRIIKKVNSCLALSKSFHCTLSLFSHL